MFYFYDKITKTLQKLKVFGNSGYENLKDHHPKTVICLDPEEPTYNGIVQRNATKWPLSL